MYQLMLHSSLNITYQYLIHDFFHHLDEYGA